MNAEMEIETPVESEFAPLVREHHPEAAAMIDDDTGEHFIADVATELSLSVAMPTENEAWRDAWERIWDEVGTESPQDTLGQAISPQNDPTVTKWVNNVTNAKPYGLATEDSVEVDADLATGNVAHDTGNSSNIVEIGENTESAGETPPLVSDVSAPPLAASGGEQIEPQSTPPRPSSTHQEQPAAGRRTLLTRIGYLRDDVAAKAVEISRASDAMKILKGELKDITKELSEDEAEYERLYGHVAERDELGDDFEMEVRTGVAVGEASPLVSTSSSGELPDPQQVDQGQVTTPTAAMSIPAATLPANDTAGNADLWVLFQHGATRAQVERLNEQGVRTIGDLEAFMRAGNLTPGWMKKNGIKGMGEAACAKISDAWGAYRREHPIEEVAVETADEIVLSCTADEIAYDEGATAASIDESISANPYSRGTGQAIAWDRGYTEWEGE